MRVTVIRIQDEVITCKIEDEETIIDIDQKWFPVECQIGYTFNFEYQNIKDIKDGYKEYIKYES